MKMFCPPTDKTCERCQKGAEWGLLAVLAPFVSGGAGIFEISTHGPISGNSAGVSCMAMQSFAAESYRAVTRVYDDAGSVTETHEQAGDFKEW